MILAISISFRFELRPKRRHELIARAEFGGEFRAAPEARGLRRRRGSQPR
jgi:hypothetical protein